MLVGAVQRSPPLVTLYCRVQGCDGRDLVVFRGRRKHPAIGQADHQHQFAFVKRGHAERQRDGRPQARHGFLQAEQQVFRRQAPYHMVPGAQGQPGRVGLDHLHDDVRDAQQAHRGDPVGAI